MSLYFPQEDEWLTWEQIIIDTVNACITKQRSSRLELPAAINSKHFVNFLRDTLYSLNSKGAHEAIANMRRQHSSLKPALKRLVLEMAVYAEKNWKPIMFSEFQNCDDKLSTKLTSMALSKNAELLVKLRSVWKLSPMKILQELDLSDFVEFSNSMYLASRTPENPSYDRIPFLPESESSLPLLILDIDETLIHTFLEPPKVYDFTTTIQYTVPVVRQVEGTKKTEVCEEIMKQTIFVRERPFLRKFLSIVSQYFEVATWTASIQNYADAVVDHIDPERQFIQHRLYRQHCTCNNNSEFIKDLRRLGRDNSKTIIVDNSCLSFAFQLENGIPIYGFIDDENDMELMHLIPLLAKLAQQDDVRNMLRDTYKLEEMKKKLIGKNGVHTQG